jgi:hypothetical protein
MLFLFAFICIILFRSIQTFLGGSFAIQWFFAVISICGFFFGLFILPETHGKKLTEIEAYFRGDDKKVLVKSDQKSKVATSKSGIETNEIEVMIK